MLDTLENKPDTMSTGIYRGAGGALAAGFNADYRYLGSWLEQLPNPGTQAGRDSLLRITAVRYSIPPGIGKQSDGDNVDNSAPNATVADDSLDNDAGFMKFMVRIR
jgi:hypothetical protein